MNKSFKANIPSQEITPKKQFFGRRTFLSALGSGLITAPFVLSKKISGNFQTSQSSLIDVPFQRPDVFPAKRNSDYELPRKITHAVPILGQSSGLADTRSVTPREIAASHNNFYEFLAGRGGPVWEFCGNFDVDPWKIEITGECHSPTTLDLDDLFRFEHEERLYHFRCVERWAMNVPWSGFPLHKLLERVQPTSAAQYVRFETALNPEQMPGVTAANWYPWPYQEALRLDEAMHELSMVVTGVYGDPLLRQHGAPVRIIVPWKYGYKNPKSIVKIELVREKPQTFWQTEQPHEYGFLSNVNPNIPHPRWPQNISYWLDTEEHFLTPIFNGYEEYVADLYPDEPRQLQEPLHSGELAR